MNTTDMENHKTRRRLSASKFLQSSSQDEDTIYSDYTQRRNLTVPNANYMKKQQSFNQSMLTARSKPELKSQPNVSSKYGFLQGCRKFSCISRMYSTDNELIKSKPTNRDLSSPPHYQNSRKDPKEKKSISSFMLGPLTPASFAGTGHDNACYRSSTDTYSLVKQFDAPNFDNDYEELANIECYGNKKAPKKCESVRICPVLQNGHQISNTHYWILASRKCRQFHSNPNSENDSDLLSPSVTSKQSSSVDTGYTDDGKNAYMNLNNNSANVYSPCPFLSAESCMSKNYSDLQVPIHSPNNNVKDKMIEVLGNEVPQATRKECEAVLIGQSWEYSKAIQRLKLDILCRHVRLSRKELKSVLRENQWDLTGAIEHVRKLKEAESHTREIHASEKRYNSCSPNNYVDLSIITTAYPFSSRRSRSIRHLSSISHESLNSGVPFTS